MAVNINVPSQVKTYANLAAFPASGALKTIYIAEDTNKTYRWTGSVYTEISATAASTWGAIGGTLSNQTDLQTALNAKQNSLGYTPVPETRTLTINGTTQDLSADRTFTISTGITIGATAIASGANGRFLFDDAGVVSETNGAFWDKVNGRFGLGTSTPAANKILDIRFDIGSFSAGAGVGIRNINSQGYSELVFDNDTTPTTSGAFVFGYAGTGTPITNTAYFFQRRNAPILFGTNDTNRMTIYGTGNIGINTTTDAGFRLDVNGTARVQGLTTLAGTITASGAIARNQLINGTLVAAANNDTLVGLDINSTFTNGAFTGIDNFSLRINGGKGVIGTTANTGVFPLIVRQSNYSGLLVQNSFTGTNHNSSYDGFAFWTNNDGAFAKSLITNWDNNGIYIYNSGISPTGLVLFGATNNLGLNTTTDAGFKLDVNGTARVQGALTVTGTQILFNGAFYNTVNDRNHFGGAISISTFLRIGTNANTVASAILQADSTTKGFLPPRMTTTEKNAIASPATGLMVYDNVLNRPCFYDGTTWITL